MVNHPDTIPASRIRFAIVSFFCFLSPMNPATTLAEIRRNCSPKPLEGNDLRDFFVETSEARDNQSNLRIRLTELFTETDSIRRVLVYGHRGSGKSTELNRFRQDLGTKNWFTVHFSSKELLPDFGIHPEDILLAIAVAIFEAAEKEKLKVSNDHLKQVQRYFAEVTTSDASTREANIETSAGAGVEGQSFWASLLGLHASIKGDLKFGTRSQESTVMKVRRAPSELINALDALILAVETAIQKQGRRLLIIVEDLDKMNLADAHRVFAENAPLLARPSARLIYTIPLFTFHSSEADAIRAAFDETLPFPMMEVVDLKKNLAPGYHVIADIIRRRVSTLILEDDAMDLLIRGTGGVLRNVFEVLLSVSSYRTIQARPIQRGDIRTALDRLSRDLGAQIGWPRNEDGTREAPDDLFVHLAEIAHSQAAGKAVYATSDSRIEVLLRSGSLIEYNGGGWLGVHPLARKFLADLGHDVGPDPYGIES